MPKKITIQLSEQSIKQAIKDLSDYQKWVEQKTARLIERLAIIGAQEASIRFASAQYDGVNDSSVSVEPMANGWKIVANGETCAFIEWGSGVYHNHGEPYPNPPGRPAEVAGIGEYGHGYGKRRGWVYEGVPGSSGRFLPNGKVFTRGNPASMPMYYSTQEMLARVTEIAKEVFSA